MYVLLMHWEIEISKQSEKQFYAGKLSIFFFHDNEIACIYLKISVFQDEKTRFFYK